MASKQEKRPVKRDSTGKFAGGSSGNPKGRPRKDKAPISDGGLFRNDTWNSILTGLGVAADDKRTSVGFAADIVTDGLAAELWRGDDIAARVIEEPPGDMLREGFELVVKPDEDEIAARNSGQLIAETPKVDRKDGPEQERKQMSEDVIALWDDMQLTDKLERVLQYERAYGGGALLLGVKDNAGSLELPLDPARVRELSYLTTLEKRELVPETWYTDPFAPKFGEPKLWRVTPTAPGGSDGISVLVHESRLLIFGGVRVSRSMQNGTHSGFGDSVITRMYNVLRDFQSAWGGVGNMLQDFSVAVHKIVGLAELVASDNLEAIQGRIKAIHLSRSIMRTTVIDAEEEFQRHTTSITGLPDLLSQFGTRLAAAAGMPVTRLMGTSPKGLNATGEHDLDNYYDRISDHQRKTTAKIEYLIRILMASLDYKEPVAWGIQWRPLEQESNLEKAQARKVQAETDAILIDRGMASAEEIAVSRYGGDEYSYETVIDFDERDAIMSAEPVDPNADPSAPAEPGAVGSDDSIQQKAMNGAQVSSMIEVIVKAGAKEISRESAIAILEVAFQVGAEQAAALLGPVGFEAVKPDPPQFPGAPPKPGGKPFPPKKPDVAEKIGEAVGEPKPPST